MIVIKLLPRKHLNIVFQRNEKVFICHIEFYNYNSRLSASKNDF